MTLPENTEELEEMVSNLSDEVKALISEIEELQDAKWKLVKELELIESIAKAAVRNV